MDIQAFVDIMNKTAKETSAREYSLGKLIKDLKELNLDLIVEINDGTFPKKSDLQYAEEGDDKGTCEYTGDYFKYSKKIESVFASWRGSYCELSMEFSKTNQNITVGELLKMAEFVNGKYLCGYKGGDFLMDSRTPIHIANYSECGELKLIGVKEIDGKAILITREDKDED